ncbi:hypothetical protein [Actinoplanes sp. DH11]|uniref:hypothetical protein n=1 Tax=Actinoplanes sp. DH11 TaxID=2857011 RepID=UPI001E58DE6D|nr:hypothetical protein [Actinoplanes sp. DH11]
MTDNVAERLMIKANSTVWLNEPARLPLLTPMPDGVRETAVLATAGTAVLFAENATAVREQLAEHRADLDKPGAFWIAYPKGNQADSDQDSLGSIMADFDMRPGEQVAIDERWSALRFSTNQAAKDLSADQTDEG